LNVLFRFKNLSFSTHNFKFYPHNHPIDLVSLTSVVTLFQGGNPRLLKKYINIILPGGISGCKWNVWKNIIKRILELVELCIGDFV